MSTTGTKAHTEVGAEVQVGAWTATYNFVANETATFLLNYLDHRGLDINKLVDMREGIEDAIWAYLSSGHLTCVTIEVYPTDGGRLEERFDMSFDMRAPTNVTPKEAEDMNERNFQSYHEEIMGELSQFDPPEGECTYRILIGYRATNDLGKSPPDLDDWTDASAKDTTHLDKNDLGDTIEAGPIDGTAELWI